MAISVQACRFEVAAVPPKQSKITGNQGVPRAAVLVGRLFRLASKSSVALAARSARLQWLRQPNKAHFCARPLTS
jgi:hypothetical protein